MPKGRPGSPRLLFLSPHCRRDVASSVWDIWPSEHSSCRGARWSLILPTAAAGSSAGGLSGSTAGAGAGDILFASAAAAAGCASFGSTAGVLFCSSAAAGSSAGVFVSCAGRGRGSGGDDTIRWRCAPVPVTWWNQVITLCATLETGGCALGGVGGCGPCAWADVAANNWRDRKNVAAPNTLDLMVGPPAARNNEREAVSWRSTLALSTCLRASFPAPAG